MSVLLAYDPAMAEYRFDVGHPMLPERFTLAVSLMESWGLLAGDRVRTPALVPAPDALLQLTHSSAYIDFVKRLSVAPDSAVGHGIGPGDTPAFRGMHEAAALAVAGTVEAVREALATPGARAMCPAGGLHHAHRDRASGFCIYNDCAVAIAAATREHPGCRIAYVDIDVHHGDGVEAAFQDRSDVLTVSVHESGKYLFPGTGRTEDIGHGEGRGFAVNVPMPPYSGPQAFLAVFSEVIAPALESFRPDLIVLQAGADTHAGDPLAHVQQTVAGYLELVKQIVHLAEDLTRGSIVITGGGGYQPFTAVPRMWAGAMAVLENTDVPDQVPSEWREKSKLVAGRLGRDAHWRDATFDADDTVDPSTATIAYEETLRVITRVRAVSPLLAEST